MAQFLVKFWYGDTKEKSLAQMETQIHPGVYAPSMESMALAHFRAEKIENSTCTPEILVKS